jgi:hypothetical protein
MLLHVKNPCGLFRLPFGGQAPRFRDPGRGHFPGAAKELCQRVADKNKVLNDCSSDKSQYLMLLTPATLGPWLAPGAINRQAQPVRKDERSYD